MIKPDALLLMTKVHPRPSTVSVCPSPSLSGRLLSCGVAGGEGDTCAVTNAISQH
jgi:hypothetical protein